MTRSYAALGVVLACGLIAALLNFAVAVARLYLDVAAR